MGTQNSGVRRATTPVKAGSATPTTVYGSPRSVIVRPTTPGSAPYSRRHVRSDSTSTRSADGVSSSGVSTRPRCAVTPSRAKWLPVTICPRATRERSPRLSGAIIGL